MTLILFFKVGLASAARVVLLLGMVAVTSFARLLTLMKQSPRYAIPANVLWMPTGRLMQPGRHVLLLAVVNVAHAFVETPE